MFRYKRRPSRAIYIQNNSEKFDVGKILGNITGIALIIGAIFYFYGFLIENFFLAEFGLRNPEIISPSYLISGILFCLSILGPFTLACVIAVQYRRINKSRILQILLFVLMNFALVYLVFVVVSPDSSNQTDRLNNIGFILIMLAANVAIFYFLTDMAYSGSEKNNPARSVAIVLIISIFMVFTMVLAYGWSLTIYRTIDQQIGGGKLNNVELILKENAPHYVLTQMKINIIDNKTEPLKLISETSGEIIVMLNENEAGKIKKELISSIIYIGE